MKLVYDDIIYSLQKSGGGSVYWTEVIRPTLDVAEHYVFDSARENIFYKDLNMSNKHVLSSKGLLFKRFFAPRYDIEGSFIFHSSYFRYCKNKKAINITTVHDFTAEKYIKGLHGFIHAFQLKHTLRHSAGVVCVSGNTKKDFFEYYPWYKGKVEVIQNGFDEKTYYVDGSVEKTKDILFVGARIGYKRFDLAVEIVSAIEDTRLVIIGGGDLSASESKMLEKRLPGRYEKKGFVSNDDLRKLYNQAMFLCYPSEYEGFGIPLLEAQACGCLVVCQKKSSIPEVVNESGIYFDGDNMTESIERIKRTISSDNRESFRKLGLENVKRFSWAKSAERHQEFYKIMWEEKNNERDKRED